MTSQRSSLTLNVLAALFLAVSVTMLTDFSHRMLNSDPDSLGILSVSVQAAFTVIASSAFTRAGWSWLGGLLASFGAGIHNRATWRFGMSLGLMLVLGPLWYFLPGRLAQHYNARAFNIRNDDPGRALQDYQRALALDPTLYLAYVNLGGLFESFYRYDDAASQYRKAITANHKDPTPYNNLARMLLLTGDSLTALRIVEDASRLNPNAQVTAALLKNKAWAELNLGFYPQAIEDATRSNSAAAECILGKVYAKLGKSADAVAAWKSFREKSASPKDGDPVIEPDCKLLAEVANENH